MNERQRNTLLILLTIKPSSKLYFSSYTKNTILNHDVNNINLLKISSKMYRFLLKYQFADQLYTEPSLTSAGISLFRFCREKGKQKIILKGISMKEDKHVGCNRKFYERLKEITGCRNMSELSLFFGVSHSTITEWKKHASLPFEQRNLLKLRGLNPDWLEGGNGSVQVQFPEGSEVALKLNCPLKADIIKMLSACESCATWAGIIKTNLQ